MRGIDRQAVTPPFYVMAWTLLLTANITLGYIVAPVLFNGLSSEQAGQLMGVFLTGLYGFDLVWLSLMLLVLALQRRFYWAREAILVSAILWVALNLWGVSPLMSALKSLDVATSRIYGLTFAQWHGISQMLFLLMLLCCIVWGLWFARSHDAVSVKPKH
ncbi:MAG: DUF4149 domain-containing protein [Hydrogenovibrio sp.]